MRAIRSHHRTHPLVTMSIQQWYRVSPGVWKSPYLKVNAYRHSKWYNVNQYLPPDHRPGGLHTLYILYAPSTIHPSHPLHTPTRTHHRTTNARKGAKGCLGTWEVFLSRRFFFFFFFFGGGRGGFLSLCGLWLVGGLLGWWSGSWGLDLGISGWGGGWRFWLVGWLVGYGFEVVGRLGSVGSGTGFLVGCGCGCGCWRISSSQFADVEVEMENVGLGLPLQFPLSKGFWRWVIAVTCWRDTIQ